MRDKLLFGTIGLLAGIVVMQWTMPASQASYVSPGAGIIAVIESSAQGGRLLDANGHEWMCRAEQIVGGSDVCWQPMGAFDSPVPVTEIKFCESWWVVTTDNHFWARQGDNSWHDCGMWPGSPIAAEQSTWSKVKAKFRGKADKQ